MDIQTFLRDLAMRNLQPPMQEDTPRSFAPQVVGMDQAGPPGQPAMSMAQGQPGADPMTAIFAQMMQGGGSAPPQTGTFGGNLMAALRWYGQNKLRQEAGVPYQDPTQNALAQTKLMEQIREQRLQQEMRAKFPNQADVFNPTISKSQVPTGEMDEAGNPLTVDVESRSHSPEAKLAARVLYGINLPDTDPLAASRAEESVRFHGQLRQTSKDKRAAEKENQQRLIQSAADKAKLAEEQIKIKKQASLATLYDHAQKYGYDVADVQKAASSAMDADGFIDINKMYSAMPPGKSPAFLQKKKEHEDHLAQGEKRLQISMSTAQRLARQYKDTDGLHRFQAAARTWEQEFKAFAGDMSNFGKKFTKEPPVAEDFIGKSFMPTSPDAPQRQPGIYPGMRVAPRATGKMGMDAVDRLILGR